MLLLFHRSAEGCGEEWIFNFTQQSNDDNRLELFCRLSSLYSVGLLPHCQGLLKFPTTTWDTKRSVSSASGEATFQSVANSLTTRFELINAILSIYGEAKRWPQVESIHRRVQLCKKILKEKGASLRIIGDDGAVFVFAFYFLFLKLLHSSLCCT